jgi:polyvinyl alcohol dehydrogenase (cytochrome)
VVCALPGPLATAQEGTEGTYLYSNARTDYDASEGIINPATAGSLTKSWSVSSDMTTTQPIVTDSNVYWSDWHGIFHATGTVSHQDAWTHDVGTATSSCSGTQGPDSTPTVATVNGRDTLFVGTPTGHLLALDATTGQELWDAPLDTNPAADIWSSPALFGGSLYIGAASVADCPLVQGQLFKVDASTGAVQAVFDAAPAGCKGAGIWSSPTIDESTGDVFVDTGNGDGVCDEPYQEAIVRLRSTDLSVVDYWSTPDNGGDNDFGATPTLFQTTINGQSTAMVGALNKNGTFYALNRSDLGAGPVWTTFLAVPGEDTSDFSDFIAPAAYDGSRLYVAGGTGVISGQTCAGSLSALDPSTGDPIWQDCLQGRVLGAVLSAPGVVEVGADSSLVIANAATGATLFMYNEPSGNDFWGPSYISNGVLYAGNNDGTLTAFTVLVGQLGESPLPIALPLVFLVVVAVTIVIQARRRRLRLASAATP